MDALRGSGFDGSGLLEEHAAGTVSLRASNSIDVGMLGAEWRQSPSWQISRYFTTAFAGWTRVLHNLRSSISTCSRDPDDSMTEMAWQ